MRVVFMGTPSFAVPSLEALNRAYDVSLVVTRPDAVRGRGKKLYPSPVKEAAITAGIEVLETKRVTPEVIERIKKLQPDVIVVAAYGAILPDELLKVAPFGCINVHASLLPRWRGAAPIQRAILAGDKRAGVSIMRIAHDLDAGPYCRTETVPIEDKDCEALTAELAEAGAMELINALRTIEAGTVRWREQDERFVTYAPKVTKQDLVLSPDFTARELARRVQASSDTAPARATVCGRGLRVTVAWVADDAVPQGEVLIERKGRVLLGCADGALELVRVRPDGKREMEAHAWAQGAPRDTLTWDRP